MTIGLAVAKRFEWKDVPAYVITQVVAGLVAGGALFAIATGKPGFTAAGNFAANGYGAASPGGYGLMAALLVEVILTAFFLYIILGATDGRRVRDRIGFLPEERGLYKKMTPVDAIAFFGSLKGLPASEGRRRAREQLQAQGLGDAANKKMKELSKGMAQKVQILATIAHDPELVILDEPFSGLDPVNQQVLEELIGGLRAEGRTVLFSTHVMQHAERLCDRLLFMAAGRDVFEGTLGQARALMPREA